MAVSTGASSASNDARSRSPDTDRSGFRQRSFLRRPTTVAAAAVLAATGIAAAVLAGGGAGDQAVAARVGPSVITSAAVDREVAAIEGVPTYRSALSRENTMALAAPVDPKAVAAATGDPDDLRISLVPANGAATTRRYTTQDLRASVLTRLLYVTALEQILDQRRLRTSATDRADGLEQARLEAGQDTAGDSLFDRLPSWYRAALAQRGADVEDLERSLVGNGGITPAAIVASYAKRLPMDFTTVCLRAAVVPAGQLQQAKAMLASGKGAADGKGTVDGGCAAMADWAPDVVAAVRRLPTGALSAPLPRGRREAVLQVTRRTTLPLAAVRGNIVATLSERYTDSVNAVVEDQLALSKVTVSSQFGTYEDLGSTHGVLPPDALTPPSRSTGPVKNPPEQRQKPDPFD